MIEKQTATANAPIIAVARLATGAAAPVAARSTDREEVPTPAHRGRGQHQGQRKVCRRQIEIVFFGRAIIGLIPLPDHFECATASSPLSKHRSPGSDSIQTDLGSVLARRQPAFMSSDDPAVVIFDKLQ
jgi:hypothetical protein